MTEPRSTLEPGSSLDRYSIEALIGGSGRDKVYRALDTHLRRTVALKVYEQGGEEGEGEALAAALREARAAAAILHPSVTAIYDAVEASGVSFIVMELVTGTSLRRFVGDGAVPVARRVRWLAEVARALAAAHEGGVIHRDITPENVMVTEEGPVKVLDFGIARRSSAGTKVRGPWGELITPSSGNEIPGTPAYMSPERIRGDKIDGRADQFSWGVVAYELLAGVLPWKRRGGPVATLAAVLVDSPEPLAAELGVAAAVGEAIARALSKLPADRFASMGEVAAALEPFAMPKREPSAPALDAPASPAPPAPSLSPPPSPVSASVPPAPLIVPAGRSEPSRARGGFEILDRGAHRLHLAAGVVLVNVWRGPITVADIRAASDAGRRLSRRYPGGIGSINVAEAATPLPDAEARQQGEEALRESQQWLLASAIVLEGRGFAASAARAVYAAMQHAVAHRRPQAVFGDVAEACAWLAARVPIEGTHRDLAGSIAEGRAAR